MPVRAVAEHDLDQILHHNNIAVPAVNALERSDLEWFTAHAHSFFVSDAPDGSIAGFLIGLAPGLTYESLNYAWFSGRYDNFIYVDRVVVTTAAQGSGLGSELYEAFASRGRLDGCEVMLAEVNLVPRNVQSLRFHDRHGFVSVGRQDTDGGAKTVTLLERRLGPRGNDLRND